MFGFFRVMLIVGILVLTGILVACSRTEREGLETALSGEYDTAVNLPRSALRDLVRDAVRRSDGEPLFETIAPDYALVGDRFHLEGEYRDPGGSLQSGYLDLAFQVEDGKLIVSIADNNLVGLEPETERLGIELSAALDDMIAEYAGQEIVRYLYVRSEGDNQLLVGHTLKATGGQGVIPLDYP